jgi:hypothetical protein
MAPPPSQGSGGIAKGMPKHAPLTSSASFALEVKAEAGSYCDLALATRLLMVSRVALASWNLPSVQ